MPVFSYLFPEQREYIGRSTNRSDQRGEEVALAGTWLQVVRFDSNRIPHNATGLTSHSRAEILFA